MSVIVLDVETTTLNKGNPFDKRNRACYFGLYDGSTYDLYDIEYSSTSPRQALDSFRRRFDNFDCIVGFNLKFDLHWLRRYGIAFSKHSVWDCQLVDFILDTQTTPHPSLDGVANKYGLDSKLSVVATEYWDKGIDTPDIPRDILETYLKQDLYLTWEIYQKQLELVL